MRFGACVAPCALAFFGGGFFWSLPAAADCALPAPPSQLAFSYPDATTKRVPANAVFWAFGDTGPVSRVLLDGVDLLPAGIGLRERAQFVPPGPLSPGSHELAIVVPRDPEYENDDGATPIPTATFRFDVTEPDSSDADAEIASVQVYQSMWRSGPLHPPAEAREGDCSDRAIDLGQGCYDILTDFTLRLELSPHPRARGYIFGNYLLPPDCTVFFPYAYAVSNDPYSIASISPAGLGADVPFEGTAEWIEQEPPPGIYRDGPPGWCAMAPGVRSAGSAGSIAALGWAVVLLARRRAHLHR